MCGAARAVVRRSTSRTVRLGPLRKPPGQSLDYPTCLRLLSDLWPRDLGADQNPRSLRPRQTLVALTEGYRPQ